MAGLTRYAESVRLHWFSDEDKGEKPVSEPRAADDFVYINQRMKENAAEETTPPQGALLQSSAPATEGVVLVCTKASRYSVHLQWTQPHNGKPPFLYDVYARPRGVAGWDFIGVTTLLSFSVTGLISGVWYEFKLHCKGNDAAYVTPILSVCTP